MNRNLIIILIVTVICFSVAVAGFTQANGRCAGCGRAIEGPCFQIKDVRYHAHCFLCDFCNQPISGSYTEYDGKKYHDFCFQRHIALRCVVCGEIIRGRYLIDYWGNASHPRHEKSVPRCDFCLRFIAGTYIDGMVKYSDGRNLCGLCAPSAVLEEGKARVLMRDVALELARRGIAVEISGIELRLVGLNELRSIANTRSRDTKGFVDYTVEKNLFGSVIHRSATIYILSGMPRVQAAGTLAHELTHVWQFMQDRLHVEEALSEGSANYASYLVLKSIGGTEAAYSIDMMMNDPDPVYGDGFRRVKSFAEREGIAAWLNLLAKKKPMLSSF